ncbi:LTA synthase family protein [Helicobacter winghamensis]
MNVENYRFSSIESLNAISLNPIMAFAWAHKNYKKESLEVLAPVDESLMESFLPHFPLFVKTPENPLAMEKKPHIMVNLMESFGSNLLAFHNDDLDLLGSLQPHIKQDFFWNRFLPYENGTAPSLSFLFFGSPITLSKSNYNKHYLPHSPIETYKKQGYKVIFLTSGNRSWYAMGDFMLTQGVDSIIDEIVLRKHYPESAKTSNSYGILDEFMYRAAFKLLKDSTQPLLILALTTSNHPPYPNIKTIINENAIPQELHNRISKNKIALLNAYTYANNAFGEFLDSIKQSPFKDNVIIAATGDHRVRDITSNASKEKALSFGVPFYLYVPKNYQHNIHYNPNYIGSHKDIFATLFALSLDSVEYLNLGGKNLLSKESAENFGYNVSVSIDNNGTYPKGAKEGYGFLNTHNLLDDNKAFASNKSEFITLYEKFLDYQFHYRLINLKNKMKF